MMIDSTHRTFPMMKKINADSRTSVEKVIVTMAAIAVNTPPSACPLTTAVIYSDGNLPHMPKRPPVIMAVAMFITTTEAIVISKNVSCHWSVSTFIKTVFIRNITKTTQIEPFIRMPSGILCPMNALRMRNVVLGMDAEKLKSDMNVAWIGVIAVVELTVTFRNLYIQYCGQRGSCN